MPVLSDLRYALRQLAKSPGFAAVALLTLALCIGANTAIFSMVNSLLVKPLPFPAPDRIVQIYNTYPKVGLNKMAGDPASNPLGIYGILSFFASAL